MLCGNRVMYIECWKNKRDCYEINRKRTIGTSKSRPAAEVAAAFVHGASPQGAGAKVVL